MTVTVLPSCLAFVSHPQSLGLKAVTKTLESFGHAEQRVIGEVCASWYFLMQEQQSADQNR